MSSLGKFLSTDIVELGLWFLFLFLGVWILFNRRWMDGKVVYRRSYITNSFFLVYKWNNSIHVKRVKEKENVKLFGLMLLVYLASSGEIRKN